MLHPQPGTYRGPFYLLVQGLVTTAGGIVFYVLLARLLPQLSVGLISFLSLVSTVFPLAFSLGLQQFASRNIPMMGGQGDRNWVPLVRRILVLGALLSMASSIASTFFLVFVFNLGYLSPLLVLMMALDVFSNSLITIYTGLILGLGLYIRVALVDILYLGSRYLTPILLLVAGYSITGIVSGWLVGDATGVVLYIGILRGYAHRAEDSQKDISEEYGLDSKNFVRICLPLYMVAVLSYFSAYIDKYVVIGLLGLQQFAAYSIVYSAYSGLNALLVQVSLVLIPQFSVIFAKRGVEGLVSNIATTRYLLTLLFAPLFIISSFFSTPILSLFFTSSYVGASPALSILLLAGVVSTFSATASAGLAIVNARAVTIAYAIGLATAGIASTALAGYASLAGVAIGHVLGVAAFASSSMWFLRTSGVGPGRLRRTIFPVASSIISAVVPYALFQFFRLPPLPMFLLAGLSYILLVRFLGLVGEDEIGFIRMVFPAPLNKVLARLLSS